MVFRMGSGLVETRTWRSSAKGATGMETGGNHGPSGMVNLDRSVGPVRGVAELDRVEAHDRFRGVAHVADVAFHPAGRGGGAELTVGVDVEGDTVAVTGCDASDSGDECLRLICIADSDQICVGSRSLIRDVDVVAAGGGGPSGFVPERSVAAAGRNKQRLGTHSGIVARSGVDHQHGVAESRIVVAGSVAHQRRVTAGSVRVPKGVVEQR